MYFKVTYGDGSEGTIKLTRVYYAPWCKNLVSIGQLVYERGLKCGISRELLLILNDDCTILTGSNFGKNLYSLDYVSILNIHDDDTSEINFAAAATLGSTRNEVLLTHLRLQHSGYSTMLSMARNGSLPFTTDQITSVKASIVRCPTCALGKSKALPFPKAPSGADRKTKEVLQLVHTDLMTDLPGDMPYVMTIIDDFSGYVWAFALRHKSDTLQTFRNWHSLMSTQFSHLRLKAIRSDNGGEYVNHGFVDFCNGIGVQHEFSVPKTPQQNGLAERMNRTLSEKVTCALLDAKLPRTWWKYALALAVWVINRVGNSRNLIPWESLNKRKISLDGLHPFGCLAYSKQDSVKFTAKATRCLMMGYCSKTKGYRLYDLEHKKHIVSRNVQFTEDVFPGLSKELTRQEIVDISSFENMFNHNNHPILADSDTENDSSPDGDSEDNGGSTRSSQSLVEVQDNQQTPVSRPPSPPHVSEPPPSVNLPSGVTTRSRGGRLHGQITYDQGGIVRTDENYAILVEENYSCLANLFKTYENDDVLMAAACEVDEFQDFQEAPGEMDAFICQADGDSDWPDFVDDADIPQMYDEAMKHPLKHYWIRAMDEQLATLKARGTFKLVDLPVGSKALQGRWVYTVKRSSTTGKLLAFKARWVIKGFLQKEGIDYKETFSPVCKATTVRLILALFTKFRLTIRQGDAISAFLLANMDKIVYILQPDGYHVGGIDVVGLLAKAIWGLRQSPMLFWYLAKGILIDLGFLQAEGDECMFIKKLPDNRVVILVIYVDDFIICSHKDDVDHYFNALSSKIDIQDRGYVEVGHECNLLGVTVTRDKDYSTHISQSGYIGRMIAKYDPDNRLKASNTPMAGWLESKWTDTSTESCDKTIFLEAVGELIYLATASRPDISFVAGRLAQFSTNPTRWHWQGFLRVLRYLKGTIDKHLVYSNHSVAPSVEFFADADRLCGR